MANPYRDNLLRQHREMLALSQESVAFLLGLQVGSDVSRHEWGKRLPSLETALAYEVVLGAPVADLFAPRSETIREAVARRAARLIRERAAGPPLSTIALASLTSLANSLPPYDIKHS